MNLKNKRGVSVIIGYVMLIAIVIAISVGIYHWMKSYVPQDALTCPDGTSVSIPDYIYDCSSNQLNFSLKNTGTFSVAGYFIKATNNSNQNIATINLVPYYTGIGTVAKNSILFSGYLSGLNPRDPGSTIPLKNNGFNLPSSINHLVTIEITPARYVTYNNQVRFSTCGNAKISEKVSCSS